MIAGAYVEVDDADLLATLEGLIKRTENVSPFLSQHARPWLTSRIAARFTAEGDDASGKWAELAMTTRAIRVTKGFPAAHPINERTGGMLRHLMTSYSITGDNTLNIPKSSSGKMAEKVKMAQRGGYPASTRGARRRGPSRPAPARPVLAMSDWDRSALTTSLRDWLLAGGSPW